MIVIKSEVYLTPQPWCPWQAGAGGLIDLERYFVLMYFLVILTFPTIANLCIHDFRCFLCPQYSVWDGGVPHLSDITNPKCTILFSWILLRRLAFTLQVSFSALDSTFTANAFQAFQVFGASQACDTFGSHMFIFGPSHFISLFLLPCFSYMSNSWRLQSWALLNRKSRNIITMEQTGAGKRLRSV